jgi:hypothetical protein
MYVAPLAGSIVPCSTHNQHALVCSRLEDLVSDGAHLCTEAGLEVSGARKRARTPEGACFDGAPPTELPSSCSANSGEPSDGAAKAKPSNSASGKAKKAKKAKRTGGRRRVAGGFRELLLKYGGVLGWVVASLGYLAWIALRQLRLQETPPGSGTQPPGQDARFPGRGYRTGGEGKLPQVQPRTAKHKKHVN